MDAQVKTEAIEDSIDAIDTSMQYLIDEADSYLRAIHSRRQSLNSNIASFDGASTSWDSTGNNSSTLADSTGSHSMGISGSAFADSTGRYSTTSSYSSALTDSIDSDGTGITGSAYAGSTGSEETNESIPPADNITAASSVPSVDNNNSSSSSTESAGSDSTVLYSLDETMPRAPRTISPITIGDDSIAGDVIAVEDVATAERVPRRRRRNQQLAEPYPRSNISIIDLSDVPIGTPPAARQPSSRGRSESVVIISSSDEENEGDQPPPPRRRINVTQNATNTLIQIGNVSIDLSAPDPSSVVELTLSGSQNDRYLFDSTGSQQRIEHNYTRDFGDIDARAAFQVRPARQAPPRTRLSSRAPAPAPAPAPSPRRAAPPAAVAANSQPTDNASTGKDIICPICYESLADRPALSTICGHLFCADCIKRAQQLTKQCPMCKKKLWKASQMHPIYFTVS
uniref:RING-type domain-containing protein n=1 Tax=Anopheles quadriannulatus TaxID=34691 RepID=A0A182X3S5_ANOQN